MIWLLMRFMGAEAAKRFAPMAWKGLAAIVMGGLVWAYVAGSYGRGFTAGQVAWESAAIAAFQAENEKLRGEAEALRLAQQTRDLQYAKDLSDITRRLVAGSRRDHVAFSAGVVGMLNEGTDRANFDISASAGVEPGLLSAASASDSGSAGRRNERGGGG
ncbi:hypothetical protein [Hyphococcus sp.]|uniref:hypothetical protein n=1 Tax=Hyphococcus sp. TaxID=2038636 RepID=UPI00207DB594|nr:MAG: hypothetical protein DHS20C04_28150 [Marinicaulis sp.]